MKRKPDAQVPGMIIPKFVVNFEGWKREKFQKFHMCCKVHVASTKRGFSFLCYCKGIFYVANQAGKDRFLYFAYIAQGDIYISTEGATKASLNMAFLTGNFKLHFLLPKCIVGNLYSN